MVAVFGWLRDLPIMSKATSPVLRHTHISLLMAMISSDSSALLIRGGCPFEEDLLLGGPVTSQGWFPL